MSVAFSIIMPINAPPAQVWSIMSDLESWPQWTKSVTKIRRVDEGPLRVGSQMWIHQPKFPPALWKVTALEPNRGFTGISTAPGLLVTTQHTIEPVADGSIVTLSITYNGLFGGLFARLSARINNEYLAMEANGLKKRSEELASQVVKRT